ncbi:hypothetical protein [Streptomyces sp. NPDC086989]|uniref:hypothetical protein n=1 Tax=Streptomyces sp. NPDC086989 TaxID=3365764 RepID=UPI00380FBCE8
MVPRAEAWDSGASAWTPARREAYANDQGQASSLIAVTARSNRSNADHDPSHLAPPGTRRPVPLQRRMDRHQLRWQLTVDEAENDALQAIADKCGDTVVTYTPAP